ncbi:retrovirus-related pol polyprotein from transposon TNT 1-94 [Tanacetum coccineum]
MKENESVQAYLARVSAIVSQIRSYGEKITNETIVAKVLRSLTPKFDHVDAAIEESKDLYQLSFDELMGSLQAHEVRINRNATKEEEKAFQIKEGRFLISKGISDQGRPISHINAVEAEKYCWSKPKGANYAKEDGEQDDYLFMVETKIEKATSDVWYVDSVCSHHITEDKSKFNDLDGSIKSHVRLGDDKNLQIKGRGSAAIIIGNTQRAATAEIKGNGGQPLVHCAYERMHADLCGPVRTKSLGEQKFKALVEKESRKDLQVLRTDHGERKYRTVVEMARSILKSKELPANFWVEGVVAVVYLLNISPTKSVWNMTLYEAWYGNKPSVSHLRIFGCLCYALRTTEKHILEEKSQKDVMFDEQASWVWNDKVESSKNKLIEVEELSRRNTEEVIPIEEQSPKPTRSSSSSSLSTSVKGSFPHESMPTPATQLHRSQRGHIPRCRFLVEGELDNEADNVTLLALFAGDPVTVDEALKHEEWRGVMEDELQSFQRNQTWEQAYFPEGKNVIALKWIFKTKFLADGSIEKYKARFVVRGFTQQQGVDYEETFAPVARFKIVRMILPLAAQNEWKIF